MADNASNDPLTLLRGFDTPTVSNAVEGLNLRHPTEGHLGRDIQCYTPELGVMAGYAVTATIDNSRRERTPDAKGVQAFYRALAEAPKPAVVVMQDVSDRPGHSCHFGDIVCLLCKRLGAVGMVTDGAFRDLAGIRQWSFHVFANGRVASRGLYQWIDVNVPVTLSGTTINPGDLVHGDENGVITVPADAVGRLPEAALAVREKEAGTTAYGLSPYFSLEGLLERLK